MDLWNFRDFMTASNHSYPGSQGISLGSKLAHATLSDKAVTEGSKDNCGKVINFHIHYKYDVMFILPYMKNKMVSDALSIGHSDKNIKDKTLKPYGGTAILSLSKVMKEMEI